MSPPDDVAFVQAFEAQPSIAAQAARAQALGVCAAADTIAQLVVADAAAVGARWRRRRVLLRRRGEVLVMKGGACG